MCDGIDDSVYFILYIYEYKIYLWCDIVAIKWMNILLVNDLFYVSGVIES